MVFIPFFLPDSFFTKVVHSVIFTVVLLIGLNLTKPGSFVYRLKEILFFVTIILVWLNVFKDHEVATVAAVVSYFLFFGLVARTLFISIKNAKEVDVDVILGAVSGYLILAICFSFFLGAMYSIDPGSFNFPGQYHNMKDIYYFALVSMTTLGYGEITPVTYPAKGVSLMLTLAGQLYLTVIIATLIGKFLNTKSKNHE